MLMDWMKRAWNGQERLWKVFWIYGAVAGLIAGVINFALVFAAGKVVSQAFSALMIVYWVFIAVSEWRCAFNVSWRGWGYIVRFLVILGAIVQIYNVYALFFAKSSPDMDFHGASGFTMKMDGNMAGGKMHAHTMMMQQVPATGGATNTPVVVIPGTPVPAPGTAAPATASTPAPTPVPAAASAVVPAPADNQSRYKAACEQYMGDYARKSGTNPQDYIAKNQAYLQQCIQIYMSKDAAKAR